MQSVPFTINIMSYMIKFVSDLQQVSGFLRVLWNIVESGIKYHNPKLITPMLYKTFPQQ